jgi:hypothetical protein
MARVDDFDSAVPLPPGLTMRAIRSSIEYIERDLSDLVEIYLEQMNVFSALVGIFGTRALDQHSVYEKVRHTGIAQTRFPDLRRRGSGPRPSPEESLESKASKRPWALQSHYDHEGWYIVWRYLVDLTASIEQGKQVIIWRVDVAYLRRDDWKYEASRAGSAGGGRTHTFGLRAAARRLKTCAVYRRSDIALSGGKPVLANST